MTILYIKNRKLEKGHYNYTLHFYKNGKKIIKHEYEDDETIIYNSFTTDIRKRFNVIFLRNDYNYSIIDYYNINYITNIRDISEKDIANSMFDIIAFGKTFLKNVKCLTSAKEIEKMTKTIKSTI